MARITIEDCEEVVPNRFDLVIVAAQRARQLFAGDKPTVDPKDEKKPVIALREIAEESVSVQDLRNGVVKNFRSFTPEEDWQEDIEDISEEEDTYNPYINMNVKALESNSVTIVDNVEDSDEEI